MMRISQILLAAAFTASGVSGLLFETLWFRQSGLTFGNGVWATSLVLSSFMAGLAIGNGWMGRFGAAIRRPIRVFALAELVIAVTGVALVYLLPNLTDPLAPLLGQFGDHAWASNAIRLGLGFVLMVLPATAMGTTLPLLVAALNRQGSKFGTSIGWLYGWNTLGAVVGALLGEVFLIERLGVKGAAWVAGGLDLGVAGVALAIASLIETEVPAADSKTTKPGRLRSAGVWCLLAASFAAGWILLALEVTWFRFLHLFVHPGPATFSAMLAVVLLGIAVGGFCAAAWLHYDAGAYRHASVIGFMTGANVLAVYWAFDRVITAFGLGYAQTPFEIASLALPLILPAAVFSGILFTFTASALNDRLGVDTEAAGLATLANTIGSGLGSIAGGFVLLPLLGMEGSFALLGGLYLGVGLLLLPASREPSLSFNWNFVIRGLAALIVIGLVVSFPYGRMRSVYLDIAVRPFGVPEREQVVGVLEGRSQTVIYLQSSLFDEPVYHRLVTGAFSMSTSGELARRYMKLFVYWPVAFHPDAKRALLISYGVGATAKALTDTRALEQIDIVDISHEVLDMSELVYPGAASPLADPRVRVHIEDGRHFLQLADTGYDIITAEPPPPRHAGVVNLYSREYFQLIRDRLNSGGIATYWLPVHSLTRETSRAITRAFCDVFPDCSMWAGFALNWMLVGSAGQTVLPSEEFMGRQWRDPDLLPELRAVGVERVEQLGALFIADADQLGAFIDGALPVVDDYPKRIHDRPASDADVAFYADWMNVEQTLARFDSSAWIDENWPADLRVRSRAYFDEQGVIDEIWAPMPLAERLRKLHRVLTETDLRTLPIWTIGGSTGRIAAAERLIARGVPLEPVIGQVALRALGDRDYETAGQSYRLFRETEPESEPLAALELYMAIRADRSEWVSDVLAGLPVAMRSNRALCLFFQETFGVSIADDASDGACNAHAERGQG
jgi:spermidine synthase